MRKGRLGWLAVWAALSAAHPPLHFIPAGTQFVLPSEEYQSIWEEDGARIIAVMEDVTGLVYPDTPIEVIVSDSPPMTAYDGRTIRVRARYSLPYKKATLVHELGHRLAFTLPRPSGLDDHQLLYLFLYDVWTDLFGKEFADRMAGIERRIGPAYAAAWDFALSLSREQRQQRLRELRDEAENEATSRVAGRR